VELQQSLYDGGSTRSAVRIAEADLEVNLAEARQTEADILYALRIAFADLLYAQTQIGLLEQIRNRRADNVEMVELRYEGGQEHQGSLALNRASLSAAETDLEQALRFRATARLVLARALGRADTPGELLVSGAHDDVLPPPAGELGQAAAATPAYLRRVAASARATAALDSARSGHRPDLLAYGSAARYGEEPALEDDNFTVGVRLSWDLWSGGRVGAEVQQAAARKMAADADRADTLLAQRAELEQVRLDYQRAWDAVAVEEQFLAAQDTRATIGRAQYGSGLLSFDNWDIMENDVISRQKSLLEARRQVWRAEAAWWRAIGRGLDIPSGEQP
jgi:outer membrane protein TolC